LCYIYRVSFGALLRTTRLQLEVSSEAIAAELRVHHETVCRWERGDWMPAEAMTVVRSARFLGVDPMPLLVAWGRDRGCYPLPPTGDDRDLAAAAAALCWASVPTAGPVVVTLQPGSDPLRIVRGTASDAGPVLPVDGTERDQHAAVIASRWSTLTLEQVRELSALFQAPTE